MKSLNLEFHISFFKSNFRIIFFANIATSLTVIVSFVKLNISDFSLLFSINLKHLATSIRGTKLLICLPPATLKFHFEKQFLKTNLALYQLSLSQLNIHKQSQVLK